MNARRPSTPTSASSSVPGRASRCNKRCAPSTGPGGAARTQRAPPSRAPRSRRRSTPMTPRGRPRSGAKAARHSCRPWPACRAFRHEHERAHASSTAELDFHRSLAMNTSIVGAAGTVAYAPSSKATGETPVATITRKGVAAAIAGNALEFYDFVLYAYFAIYIGQAFFPIAGEFGSLLASVATFGVGFFTRPLGSVLIGAFADRAGRKPALILTVALITLGTLGIAATPSYATIGIAAPIIVVVCRLLQGLALGGEVGPATALLLEMAPRDKRGYYTSWQMASQGLAVAV